jgi:hypothetical protein
MQIKAKLHWNKHNIPNYCHKYYKIKQDLQKFINKENTFIGLSGLKTTKYLDVH